MDFYEQKMTYNTCVINGEEREALSLVLPLVGNIRRHLWIDLNSSSALSQFSGRMTYFHIIHRELGPQCIRYDFLCLIK